MSNLRKRIDPLLHWSLFLCVAISVITTICVTILLGKESFVFFSQVSIVDFLFGTKWEPLLDPKSFGVLPLVSGTFLIVIGAMLFAGPMGLLIATYLSEFSSENVRNVIKPVMEILAGIPTVVYGYFALSFVTPILQKFFPETSIFNAASAAIVVGIMILPMITSLCDDAFQAIPNSLREGGYALGATPLEVIVSVVWTAASARIGAAFVLAISRAVGETMAVTLAAGATPNMTINPLESIQTMTAYIVQVSMGDTESGGIEYLTCFSVGALLFVLTLIMNVIGNHFIFKKAY